MAALQSRGEVLSALIERASQGDKGGLILAGGEKLSAIDVLTRVRGLAAAFQGHDAIAAIGLSEPILALADLASIWAGIRLVSLPAFFSAAQIGHCLAAAEVTAVVLGDAKLAALLPAPLQAAVINTMEERLTALPDPRPESHERIIFTSGTTGRPKGVRIGMAQLDWMVTALHAAVGARADDHHVSALPQALLLEQIAGLHLPILAGARVSLLPTEVGPALAGTAEPLFARLAALGATTTILTPRLLGAWLRLLQGGQVCAPSTLRLAAVGGAPVPPGPLRLAREIGLPVRVGYGLSECGSVVALGEPGDVSGSVGCPLDGLRVEMEGGEIVVSGPSVMAGYLGETPLDRPLWRTGDLGRFDREGRLHVDGRRDTLLVAASGRNIAPEWVEEACELLPDVQRCLVTLNDEGDLIAALVCALKADPAPMSALAGLGLPDYARPQAVLCLEREEAEGFGLLVPARKAARSALAALSRQKASLFQYAA